MFFYILIVPPLIISLLMICRLRKMEKHDKVLYRFCQIRRETMTLMREKNFDLTREDYVALRQIAEVTSATISDYNNCKIYLFNFRRFVAAIRRMEKLEIAICNGRKLKNEITALRNRQVDAMMFAFTTFTPFFKSERVFRVAQYAFAALAKLGIEYFKKKVRGMAEIESWRDRHTPTFG